MKVVFVTGNQNKADYLSKLIGLELDYQKIDLDEIQSLDLKEIVKHKVIQAYEKIKKPVLVEDVSLEFKALGQLPGPFIKFFIEQMRGEDLCRLVDGKDRDAVAKCVFGYYDGQEIKLFQGSLTGKIANKPAGENGFGWDKIFIPEGYEITRAQMNENDDLKTYKSIKPIDEISSYLKNINLGN